MSKNNCDWALEYAALGWPVFPVHYVLANGQCSCRSTGCKRIGKHPTTARGLKDATTDAATITAWWLRGSPYANIGLAVPPGMVVMDADDYGMSKATGKPKAGSAHLAELTGQYGELPWTRTCKTGSGGFHRYFSTRHSIKNSQDLVAPDIDVRGQGGYVILPPSNHYTGGHYEWVGEDTVAELPDWLMSRMTAGGSSALVDVEELQPEVKKEAKQKFTLEQLVKLLEFIPPDCDRDTWWKVGAALKRELGDARGFEAWKAWSAKVTGPKGWDEVTGSAQWRSFAADGPLTGGTIYKFATDAGFRGFDREAADAPEIVSNWVYVTGIKRFVEIERMIEWDREQFDAHFAQNFSKGVASTHEWKNENFKKLLNMTYWPQRDLYVEEDKQLKLNSWRKHPIEPEDGGVEPLLEHLEYLIEKPEDRELLLDYLAFQIQYPGEKVHWAMVLQGIPGTGKSYFSYIMKLILGEHNVRSVTNETLHENFTGWARSCQLVIVEEIMAGKRMELMNKLKPMITEPWVSIREMYRPPQVQPNRMNFLFFTNYKDALIVDNEDRRYCVIMSPAEPKPKEYYVKLFNWSTAHIGRLYRFLSERQIKIYPKAHAPMTDGKREMIGESMRPLDHTIKGLVDNREWPFIYNLVSPGSIATMLSKSFNIQADPKEIGRAFGRLGYFNLGARRLETGERTRISAWAVRDFDSYRVIGDEALRGIWNNQVNLGPQESPGVVDVMAMSKALVGQKPM